MEVSRCGVAATTHNKVDGVGHEGPHLFTPAWRHGRIGITGDQHRGA
jgi:hypothetical protein